jgi:hypothetical protein
MHVRFRCWKVCQYYEQPIRGFLRQSTAVAAATRTAQLRGIWFLASMHDAEVGAAPMISLPLKLEAQPVQRRRLRVFG